jgi:3-phenylpropionate/cinnamic acid dioxygenase small subunit
MADELRHAIEDFLYLEAELLDERRLRESRWKGPKKSQTSWLSEATVTISMMTKKPYESESKGHTQRPHGPKRHHRVPAISSRTFA